VPTIGPYRIVRSLGFGRTSEVLLATRMFLGDFERTVVVKRLLTRSEEDPEGAGRQVVRAAEALAYARVSHPAIVQLFDLFSHEGHLALVLEYVDGLSLAKLVAALRARRQPLGDRVALFIASRIFAALAAAHAAKDPRTGEPTPVIHRDVSPTNVLVPWDGFAKLGGFDLSKVIGVSDQTLGGLMKGTYGYMAPEQVTGDPVTPRTDVYAGCLVLRELLLGRPAFDEGLPELELLTAMLDTRITPIDRLRRGIPRRLAYAIDLGLSRDPKDRTVSAAEMVELLRSYVDMEVAHGELVARLARVRPAHDDDASLGIGIPTPSAMTISNVESFPPIEEAPPSSSHARSMARPLLLAATLTFVVVFGLVTAAATTLRSTASAPPPASVATPELVPAPVALPLPSLAPVPAPASSFGAIVPPSAARHHRIWIDGEVIDPSGGPTIRVPCGTHVVRIGSAGASQSVNVPCGGRVTLSEN
jgi:serine/threonine protein kinase